MKIKWIANNTLQASYPDYPGFPRSYWLGSEGEAVKFHFPGRAEFYANENAATANDQ